jgi:predicted transposase/invertase (TIGR01784 family)
MSKELLSVKNDYIFKRVFANPQNGSALADFLKAVLDLPESEFDRLDLADPHVQRRHKDDKLGILDVKVYTASGKVIDIEIQVLPEADLKERILFYLTRLLSDQAERGGDYANIRKVISVVITDFQLIDDSAHYHNRYYLHDPNTGSTFTDIVEVNTLELPKLPEESDESNLWDWLRFMKVRKESEMAELAKKNPQIEKVVATLREMSEDEIEWELALNRQRDMMAERGRWKYAMQKGMEKGIEKGIEKGERDKAVAIAKKLKEQDIPIEIIATSTGLSINEIKSL